MKKSIRILGRTVPAWLLAILCAGVVVAATIIVGTVRMPWDVTPPAAEMTPGEIEVPIGSIVSGHTKTSNPVDTDANLIVREPTDISIDLGGDYSGFTNFAVTMWLVQDGMVKYEAVIAPTIVVSNPLNLGPTGVGGWSDPIASVNGEVVTCFVRNIGSGEGDYAQLVKWAPGATITVGDTTYEYPNTPFGYTYDEGETGYIIQNDNDAGESLQLVLVYPPTSVIIENVDPGTYDIYVGYSVTAVVTDKPLSGEATLSITYSA